MTLFGGILPVAYFTTLLCDAHGNPLEEGQEPHAAMQCPYLVLAWFDRGILIPDAVLGQCEPLP